MEPPSNQGSVTFSSDLENKECLGKKCSSMEAPVPRGSVCDPELEQDWLDSGEWRGNGGLGRGPGWGGGYVRIWVLCYR